LVQSLPQQSVVPDMTAHWEQQLNGICEKQLNYDSFMGPLENNLAALIEQAKQPLNADFSKLPAVKPAHKKKVGYKRKRKAA